MSVTNVKSNWESGNLVFRAPDATELLTLDGTLKKAFIPGVLRNVRARATAAQINGAGGYEILPAIAGFKYRIVDVTLIAIGGNAAGATSVDIVTTQGASAVRPIVAAVAALTRSAVVKPNSANVAVLADGASFVANDANTGVYLAKQAAAGDLATATHVDVSLSYVLEAA
jgi:hypothetical protein